MRIYELINKKKRGGELRGEEIRFMVNGFTSGEIPDYQMSALLMAIYFKGMTARETAALTMAMADSGERVDLSSLAARYGVTADKHSTGGVGDKTTLAVVPIVAACGVPIAKMSGRGLGHTGGTADKLEAIPGFRLDLSGAEFMQIVEKHGACIAAQSANLAPADKKIYALRDVTATVDSIPLIAASIMSKKIAAGADVILLDVKTGSGAFMKNPQDARALAQAMVEIGNNCGRKTAAIITDMSAPLGYAIGNALEVAEVIQILSGTLPAEAAHISAGLITLCEELSAEMLFLANKGTREECAGMVKHAIASGAALKKLTDIIEAQGGDRAYIEGVLGAVTIHPVSDTNRMKTNTRADASAYFTLPAPRSGYIAALDTEAIGLAAMTLGAGRARPEDTIDPHAGVILQFKQGDYIETGQPLCRLVTSPKNPAALFDQAAEKFLAAVTFSQTPPILPPLIHEKIGMEKISNT